MMCRIAVCRKRSREETSRVEAAVQRGLAGDAKPNKSPRKVTQGNSSREGGGWGEQVAAKSTGMKPGRQGKPRAATDAGQG